MLDSFRYMDMTPEEIEALPDPVERMYGAYQWYAQHWLLYQYYYPAETNTAEALCVRVFPFLLGKPRDTEPSCLVLAR